MKSCIDCKHPFGAEHKRIMLTEEARVFGKRVEWVICVQCYVRREFGGKETMH